MASSTSGLDISMDNDWEYLHGGVDPGQDESIALVEAVLVTGLEKVDLEQRNNLSTSSKKSDSSRAPWAHLLGRPSESPFPPTDGIGASLLSRYSPLSLSLFQEPLLI